MHPSSTCCTRTQPATRTHSDILHSTPCEISMRNILQTLKWSVSSTYVMSIRYHTLRRRNEIFQENTDVLAIHITSTQHFDSKSIYDRFCFQPTSIWVPLTALVRYPVKATTRKTFARTKKFRSLSPRDSNLVQWIQYYQPIGLAHLLLALKTPNPINCYSE